MGVLTFNGGVHPPHNKKYTEKKAIQKAKDPTLVTIPLSQHIGAPCKPVVSKGDEVKIGQLIGEPTAFVSAPIHSSVSGVVKDVSKKNVAGGSAMCVTIESDGKNEKHENVVSKGDVDSLSGKEILSIIKDAGIVGMGGAGFPTHVKLSPPEDKEIDLLILNGAECEPYLTCDHRLMLERPDDILYGLKAIMKVLDIETGYIGIEKNKPDAIEVMTKAAEGMPIEVKAVETKYPQGAEKQLIYAISKREVPSGGLPMDAGAVVNNIATAYAVAQAIKTGMPLVERVCTITGKGINEPRNLEIKVGTPLNEIIDQCGGLKEDVEKVILGGPMMGRATSTIEVPATKTTSGILNFLSDEATLPEPDLCINCSKCVQICPANLLPIYISKNAANKNVNNLESLNTMDCIECGSCSFICPANRRLLEGIRLGKSIIRDKK